MIPAQGHVTVPLGGKDSRVKNHVMRVSLVTDVSSSVFVCIMQLVDPLQVTAPVLQASKESSVSLSATRAGMVKNVKEGAPVLMVQNAITLLANVIVLQDGRVTFAVLNAKKAHMELTALKNASIV